jgi:hypothetical protein
LRPDLPILGRHSLLKPSWTEAVSEARARIDHILVVLATRFKDNSPLALRLELLYAKLGQE